MGTIFWISYALLWVAVVGGGVLLFLVLREVGRVYLGQSSSFVRDGVEVGEVLPDLAVTAPDGESSLHSLLADSAYTTVLVGAADCSVCADATRVVARWAARSPAELGGVVLTDERGMDSHADYSSCRAAVVREDDRLHELRVRVVPFAFVVDADGTVRSKGLLNTDRDLAKLLERAGAGRLLRVRQILSELAEAGGSEGGSSPLAVEAVAATPDERRSDGT